MSRKVSGEKILIITDGNIDHPSSRIRILQYIPYLESEGFKIVWLPRIPPKARKTMCSRILFAVKKRVNLLRIILKVLGGNYQILFIQRYFMFSWLLKYCQRKRKSIIYDFDDALYVSEHDDNAEDKIISIMSHANLIITSCKVLYEYSKQINNNSVIITSAVDTKKIVPEFRENEKLTIGWIGSEWTSKFLTIIEPVIDELSTKYDFRLLLIGAKHPLQFNCETLIMPWSLEAENDHLNSMDIGIMPLFDNEFERAKGGYKLFQYMSAGKPVLASPVGINNDIVLHGENGFLCANQQEWYVFFSKLIENESLRLFLGKRGRELMQEKYSLQICASKLIDEIKNL